MAEQLKNATSGADVTQAMETISPKGIRMTITILASLPIFALYPFMQKYFSKGIMVGAVEDRWKGHNKKERKRNI